ncbi:Guanosine nucleotide diphosphate dissociation inhibitor 1 [Zea mays]|uniref:Guanosine nucleotide diphosphate dissociation inhibitor 1 n=1 Tax=Zea mays TaxID=4577 RepID=A0A3L6DQT9_MAIZE|nr:Guanosine nucleotide diphosphate dissociation inhibitor 1 [Zea mays]
MDEEYDVIVLGTGLKECILSGLLSVDGLKLWKRFRGEDKPPAHLGASRDYNVDMVPKIHKVPATDMEALKSPLMGLFEKRRARNFFVYVQNYNEADPVTHQGLDLTRITTRELILKHGLSDDTVDFIGHALALHRDDRYLNEPALDTVKRMKLYAESLARFQGGSPYIYPLYGLGELPQAFARLSAVYGGTYMLNKPECKVEFDIEGKVCGVTSEGETAKCKKVVCDPSYLPSKVRKIGKVARAIAIMSHPIPNTNESHSIQIILPQKQLGRKYVFCCSYTHNVAPKGKFIAFVSAEAETDNPQSELKPGIDLLGQVDELFFDMYDRYKPVNEPSLDNCFVSMSYDATTHFETTVTDVLSMYTAITGKTVDLSVDLSAASAAEEY